MPPASASFIHIFASAGFLEPLRQRTIPVEYAAAEGRKLAVGTALQARLCSVHPQMAGSS
jgi:hypothetical protein